MSPGSSGTSTGRWPSWGKRGKVGSSSPWSVRSLVQNSLNSSGRLSELSSDPFPFILAGILIGLNAALISIVTAWLSDMKLGYCSTGWWLSQKFCCAEISAEGAACEEWRSWGGIEPFQYIAYVLFAVSTASRLVQLLVGRMLAHFCTGVVTCTTGPVLLFSGQARQIVRSLCSRIGYIRDQVYPRWIHHQRVPQHLDTGYQESDSGKRFVFVHWSARILSRERSLCSLLRSDRACQ